MYRLMIVDDEKIIRDGLSSIIKWHELGFTVAAVAGDGASALSILLRQKIDVLLTDIQMPQLGGLDLAKRAYEIDPNIKLVIISGYSNFEYARESIELHVESYLLKPLSPKQVSEVFKRIKEKMDKERKNEELVRNAEKGLSKNVFQVEQYHREIVACIEQGNNEACKDKLDAFLLNLRQLSVPDAAQMCRFLLDTLLKHFDLMDMRAGLELFSLSYEDFSALDAGFRADMAGCIERIIQMAGQMSLLLCREAKALIEQNFSDRELTLQNIAFKLNISYGYLSRVFTEHFKISPKAYLISVRMEKARELLLKRNLKVYEIAAEVGYADSRYFSDAFKKYFGAYPSEHLKKLQSNKANPKEGSR